MYVESSFSGVFRIDWSCERVMVESTDGWKKIVKKTFLISKQLFASKRNFDSVVISTCGCFYSSKYFIPSLSARAPLIRHKMPQFNRSNPRFPNDLSLKFNLQFCHLAQLWQWNLSPTPHKNRALKSSFSNFSAHWVARCHNPCAETRVGR